MLNISRSNVFGEFVLIVYFDINKKKRHLTRKYFLSKLFLQIGVVKRRKEEINDLNTRILTTFPSRCKKEQRNNFSRIVFSSILYDEIGNQNF